MNKTLSSFLWQSIDRFSVQGIQFVLGIILSRILTPDDYGIIGIVMVFFTFCDIFVDSGFGKGLIQKTNRTNIDSSTVFFFNILLSFLCIIILWFSAPLIANFYNNIDLIKFIRVSSLTLLFNALSIVQISHLISALSFKILAKANFFATLISGFVAVILALYGWGVWSLIAQYLFRSIIIFFIVWSATRWYPIFLFSKTSFKEIYNYSSKLFLGNFVNQIISSINNIWIAKQLSVSSLGYYTRGLQFPTFIQGALASIFSNVSFPILATYKDDITVFTQKSKQFIQIMSIVTIPIMILLLILAKPLVILLLTEKWLPCVPIIQIYCIIRLFQNNGVINLNCALAMGRSDIALNVELIKIPLGLLCLIVTLRWGLYYFVLGQCFLSIINLFLDSYYVNKYLKYNVLSQLMDIWPFVVSGIIAGIIASLFYYIVTNIILQLFVVSSMFILFYILILLSLRRAEVLWMFNQIKKKFNDSF